MAFQEVRSGEFKVNASSIKIDPSLGVVDIGNVNLPAPSDSDEPNMPAVIGQPMTQQRKKFFNRKAGGTLAEQLGTEEDSHSHPQSPIPDVPHGTFRKATAQEMAGMLTPKFDKPAPVAAVEAVQIPAPVLESP